MYRSEIIELYGIWMFSFLRNYQKVFQSDPSILYSHQQCMSDRAFAAVTVSILAILIVM